MARGKAFSFDNAQLRRYSTKVQRQNDKAISATLNELSKVGIREVAAAIQRMTGTPQATVRRRIKVTKATIFNHFFSWFIRGRRLSWIQPRVLKGGKSKRGGNRIGLSHLADNKIRKRVTGPQGEGGSPPFLAKLNVIKNQDTGKRSAGNKISTYKDKTGSLIKLVGHSLPWLLNEDWEERIKKILIAMMPGEYRKQLKKLKFRK